MNINAVERKSVICKHKQITHKLEKDIELEYNSFSIFKLMNYQKLVVKYLRCP